MLVITTSRPHDTGVTASQRTTRHDIDIIPTCARAIDGGIVYQIVCLVYRVIWMIIAMFARSLDPISCV